MVQFGRKSLSILSSGLCLVVALMAGGPFGGQARGNAVSDLVLRVGEQTNDAGNVLMTRSGAVTKEEMECVPGSGGAGGGCGSRLDGWLEQMVAGCLDAHGAAIAANQVGILKRIIVISLPKERLYLEPSNSTNHPFPLTALINPQLWPITTDFSPRCTKDQGSVEADVPGVPFAKSPLASMRRCVDEGEVATFDVWESCLSIPGKAVVVPRYRRVGYRGMRPDGMVVEGVADGRLALALQHEVDHLDGVLMTHNALEEGSEGEREDSLGRVSSIERNPDIRIAMFPGAMAINVT